MIPSEYRVVRVKHEEPNITYYTYEIREASGGFFIESDGLFAYSPCGLRSELLAIMNAFKKPIIDEGLHEVAPAFGLDVPCEEG